MGSTDLWQAAEIELVYRTRVRAKDRPRITCPADAYRLFLQTWEENKIDFVEQAKLLLLNRANHVLGLVELSTGGVAGTVVDPKLAFAAGLKANASSILLAHNHPSGNLTPSEQDFRLTRQLAEAGRLLTLPLRDHLIVSKDGYYSMADNGEVPHCI